ncbi:Thioredoxin [Tenacibaculum sp. MAR_2009_124]|uniref:thioredoxin family protein n=1 Tax=Tenacibaculum sp. MAR_2009_124 TaxID=1250059 RepID=UPI000898E3E5|nr:thioredoxin family protein [Tenacibaculum sp. MAR_2009_124]SED20709.1 Thioredoxin [Tenacibaculum sp. MAR_2009_124]
MKDIIESSLQKAISYTEYRSLVSTLIKEKKSTGDVQSEDLLNYSVLNDRRMSRLDKTIKISDDVKSKVQEYQNEQTWLVLTEGWCGDAAQNIPVINKIAEENSKISLKFVLRDENVELMNEFLTNGGKAIPKLIALDKNKNVIGTWGPRPSEATSMVKNYKEKNGKIDAEFKKDLQLWYNKNKGRNTEEDLLSLFN